MFRGYFNTVKYKRFLKLLSPWYFRSTIIIYLHYICYCNTTKIIWGGGRRKIELFYGIFGETLISLPGLSYSKFSSCSSPRCFFNSQVCRITLINKKLLTLLVINNKVSNFVVRRKRCCDNCLLKISICSPQIWSVEEI